MHTCVLWLGWFTDGSSRVRPPHCGVGRKEVRRYLETRQWFCDALDRAGGADFHKKVLYQCQPQLILSSKKDDLKLHGLVQLSTDECVFEDGVLTNWSAEDELQRHYYGLPADAYSLHVQSVRKCTEPVAVHHKLSRAMGSGGLSAIDRNHPLFIAHWGHGGASHVQLGEESVDRVLSTWNCDRRPEDIPVLLLPWPIVYLVFNGSWSSILLLLRWHSQLHLHRHRIPRGPVESWPPHDAVVWQKRGQNHHISIEDICLSFLLPAGKTKMLLLLRLKTSYLQKLPWLFVH